MLLAKIDKNWTFNIFYSIFGYEKMVSKPWKVVYYWADGGIIMDLAMKNGGKKWGPPHREYIGANLDQL